MIRSKFEVNVVLLATLVIIASGLAISEAAGNLPPLYGEMPEGRIIENYSGNTINGRADTNYRLPNNTEPIHYNIELTTNVHNGSRAFTGKVQIELIATEDTRTVVVHTRSLSNYQATIRSANDTSATEYALVTSYEDEREFLTLTPELANLTLTKYSQWIVTISYEGQLATSGGFYIVSYTDESNNIHYMATTQFESTNARNAFPCYDEPAKRANYTVTINHDPSYTALSNMPKNETASRDGVTVFDRTNVDLPTYLVAFHISDYASTEGSLHGLPHQLHSKPSSVPIHEFGLVAGMLILQGLSDSYDVPFVLPRMVQLAIPGKSGAMENWGLVTYGEQYLLWNKSTSTTSAQNSIVNIIAHEFTHQWFGNHVTVRWWTYLWLKEGFATLYSYQATDDVYPQWDVFQVMQTAEHQSALNNDGIGTVVPMTHYAQTPTEISARYGTSSYAKPGSVLHMWQHAWGDKTFRLGLHKYLTNNAIGSAEEWQLFEALQSAVDELGVSIPAPVATMFVSWSQQTGYPLLTVTRDYATNTFTVTQTAYNDNKSIISDKKYYVPFNYAANSKSDYRNTTASHYLLNVAEINITDNDVGANDWLILNKQSTGYYRINYDETNWKLIAQGLVERPNRIHPRNRAQLLYDAYRFVNYDRLSIDILLNLLTYLSGEEQYAPWVAANSIITTYNAYLSGDDQYDDFKAFVASLVSNIYETLGVNDVPNEHFLRKFTRTIAVNLACLVGVENCLTDSNDKLKALINEGVAIEPNVVSQVYCNGLRSSSDNEYNYFFNDLQGSTDTTYRNTIRVALGCSETESQLQTYVNSTIVLSNSLTTAERTSILNAVYSRSGLGRLVSIDFLNNNWEAYSDLSTSTGSANPLSSDIVSLSNYVNNEEQQKKLLELVDKVRNSSKVQANLEDTVNANIKVNLDWLAANRNTIINFVSGYRTGGSATLSASLLSVFASLILLLSRFM